MNALWIELQKEKRTGIMAYNMEFQGNAVKKMYMLPVSVPGMYLCKFLILTFMLFTAITLQNLVLAKIGITDLPQSSFEMSFFELLKIEFIKVKRSRIVPLIFIAPLLVVCVRNKESRSIVNMISTMVSILWILIMVGIVVLALLINFVQ